MKYLSGQPFGVGSNATYRTNFEKVFGPERKLSPEDEADLREFQALRRSGMAARKAALEKRRRKS